MQRRFVSSDEVVYIPRCGRRYSISMQGVIQDSLGNTVPTLRNGDGSLVANLELWDGVRDYKVTLLVALAWKNHYLPIEYWNQLDVEFVEGDDIHPGNLVWLYGEHGIECNEKPGYNYVPGFTRYVINQEGMLYFLADGAYRTPHRDEYGYMWFYDLKPDVGNSKYKTSRHRMLALAWMRYPAAVDKLHVNHLDGIPGNDWPTNLEWATPKRNADHAREMGLLTHFKAVLVRNVKTGEVIEYESIVECAAAFKVRDTTIRDRLDQSGQPVFPGYHQFKLMDDLTPWRDVVDPDGEVRKARAVLAVKALELSTGKVLNFTSPTEASRELGVGKVVVWNRLNIEKQHNLPAGGYMFRYEHDEQPWPELTA